MMKRFLSIILFLLLVGSVFFQFFDLEDKTVLIIKDTEHGKKTFLAVPDKNFTLKFIHSVHKTPVYEYYTINNNNNLVLTETRFYSLGVGMPYTSEEGTFSNKNGQFCITGLHRVFRQLPLRNSPIPQHAIVIGSQNYSLLNLGQPESLMTINAAHRWVLIRE